MNRLATTLVTVAVLLCGCRGAGEAPAEKTITLIQLSDIHGHIAPHATVFEDGTRDPDGGGLARLATLIGNIRSDNPDNLLLMIGDTTHGSAEMLFTLGEAIMPALNALDIDVFAPGNWDFGWGPRVYRQRFAGDTRVGLSPNNRTTLAWMDGRPGREAQRCNQPGGRLDYDECHVTAAAFPTVAINLYDYDERRRELLGRLHDPYVIRQVGGVSVAVLGITSDSVPHQAQAFNVGLRFTMGYEELPRDIAAAREDGAELIVVLSELGLAKSVEMAREFPAIDVIFSAHSHERTPEAITIAHEDGRTTLVTETGEDDYLGRLDLTVAGSPATVTGWQWDLLPVDRSVPEDPAVRALVDRERASFLSGPGFECHTFGPNAFEFGKGHTLCEPLDAVVGHTEPTIERFNALEAIVNNANVDAILDFAQFVDPGLNDGNSLSTTNGFRFDVTILGSEDGFSGDITIGDLYAYYPMGAAVALAEFSGGRLIDHWEKVLASVFDPNPYRQRGGWFLGFTRNIRFDLQLLGEPGGAAAGGGLPLNGGDRIERVTIDDGETMADVDRSAVYTLASCYPHGNPVDEVCRTSGARRLRFIAAPRETDGPTDRFGNRQLDMSGDPATFAVVQPLATRRIFDPGREPALIKVAPDDFVHPIDALRWYLGEGRPGPMPVTHAAHGLGRVNVSGARPDDPRRGVPVSAHGGPGIVQPTQGAGSQWLGRSARPPE